LFLLSAEGFLCTRSASTAANSVALDCCVVFLWPGWVYLGLVPHPVAFEALEMAEKKVLDRSRSGVA